VKPTFTRVEPSSQSKRALRRGCAVRSDIELSVSHSPRRLSSTNASKSTPTGTAIVFEAVTENPSGRSYFRRTPRACS
jgi:hypothetical protein